MANVLVGGREVLHNARILFKSRIKLEDLTIEASCQRSAFFVQRRKPCESL